ncbi:MAG: NUDIX domain-containing protein [Proteobacteria bacterium]|nr:NUDIX domain-containing protein [Pseudomonadota bacterium]
MTAPNATRSARPRDAASLVITRGSGVDASVLLGRREPRDRFLPDMYVFPGGRVDPTDADRPAASELRVEVAGRMAWSGARSRALAVACVRETYEETGLAFGELTDDGLQPALHHLEYVGRAITPNNNPIRYHASFFHASADAASGDLLSNGELLDLAWRRFHAALELPMLDVTNYLLRVVAKRVGHLAGDELPECTPESTPFIHYRRMERYIRYE